MKSKLKGRAAGTVFFTLAFFVLLADVLFELYLFTNGYRSSLLAALTALICAIFHLALFLLLFKSEKQKLLLNIGAGFILLMVLSEMISRIIMGNIFRTAFCIVLLVLLSAGLSLKILREKRGLFIVSLSIGTLIYTFVTIFYPISYTSVMSSVPVWIHIGVVLLPIPGMCLVFAGALLVEVINAVADKKRRSLPEEGQELIALSSSFENGEITEEEYNARRAEIISRL